jgi:hypothetical protein
MQDSMLYEFAANIAHFAQPRVVVGRSSTGSPNPLALSDWVLDLGTNRLPAQLPYFDTDEYRVV